MKKLFFILVIMLASFQMQAQKKVSVYSMDYMNGKSYDIECTAVKNGNFDYYVSCASWEREDDVIGMIVKSKTLEDFTKGLRAIENKFLEWTETAKENNVTDYDKEFDVKLPSVDCYFKYGDFHFAFNKRPNAYFKITSDGKCLVLLSIRNLKATDNRFIDHKGLFIVFSSADEIENFIKAIDPQNALDKEKTESAKENLFN